MRTSITIVLSLLLSMAGIAQDEARYEELIKTAFALYEQKDYKGSAETYSKAFEGNGWKGYQGDRYNAACSCLNGPSATITVDNATHAGLYLSQRKFCPNKRVRLCM